MKRLILMAAVAVFMSGCVAKFNQQQAGLPPMDHKATVAAYSKSSFFDPYSLRDVQISDAVRGVLFYQSGYLVCVECNGKNRMGGYTGIHRTAVLIRDDRVITYLNNDSRCFTPMFALHPWPEMEMAGNNTKEN